MTRFVRRHPTFLADYAAILRWLEKNGERDWIVGLANGLDDVVRMLSELPGVGPPIDTRGSLVLRKIIFRKVPYVAWYAYDSDEPRGEIWLLRLFHARQRRPTPSIRRWTRRAGRRD